MAVDTPDPRTFKTWDDAFQYPIPAVRRLEQQLRRDIDANREKLRSLVGASYRDLLLTAERIIQMDGQIQQVDTHLGDMGNKSNSRAIEKLGRSYEKWDRSRKLQDKDRFSFASQLAVLQNCPIVISRVLRRGGATLIAAKVLVLSRLLHKTLSSQNAETPPLVEAMRSQLASLRRKLLSHIDHQFSNPNASGSTLVEAMCAFTLATSSTPTDVLRHFHHVRLEAITAQFAPGQGDHNGILKALKLYIRTLQDTQAKLSKQLGDALFRLKSQPLLKDPDIRSLIELKLDIHARWIDEDIRNFTPWIRHDDLQQKDQTESLLRDWSKQAFQTLISGLQTSLGEIEDLSSLVQIRREVLEMWLDSRNRVPRFATPPDSLEKLRGAMISRFEQLIRQRARNLSATAVELLSRVENWSSELLSCPSLWDSETIEMDISNGAPAFRKAIIDRSHGISLAEQSVLKVYEDWLASVAEVSMTIKHLRQSRWDDFDLELDEDEDDELAEEGGGEDRLQTLLSESDPRLLEQDFQSALLASFKSFQKAVSDMAKDFSAEHRGGQAMFVLRILREIRQNLPQSMDMDGPSAPSLSSSSSVVPDLHVMIAESVSARALLSFRRQHSSSVSSKRRANEKRARRQQRQRRQRLAVRALWEGTPALPVQPSPEIFKLLHRLVSSMAEVGADLWSPAATRTLKRIVREQVAEVLAVYLREMGSPRTGTASGGGGRGGGVNGHAGNLSLKPSHPPEEEEENGAATIVGDKGNDDDGDGERETTPNGHHRHVDDAIAGEKKDSSPSSDKTNNYARDHLLQALFDIFFLQHALSISWSPAVVSEAADSKRVQDHDHDHDRDHEDKNNEPEADDALASLAHSLAITEPPSSQPQSQPQSQLQGTKHVTSPSPSTSTPPLVPLSAITTPIPDAELDRLRRGAAEYWKRTALLFGLLAY
ncbi:MAG: hypothetical protein M1819_004348 [Sarea resinae]|nr:MAG: hypothetical protein M1819_004348 [Sarea resinae]